MKQITVNQPSDNIIELQAQEPVNVIVSEEGNQAHTVVVEQKKRAHVEVTIPSKPDQLMVTYGGSVYRQAVEGGFVGTEVEWITSIFDSKASMNFVTQAFTDEREAWTKDLAEYKSQVGDTYATLTQLAQTSATAEEARSSLETTLTAQINETSSALNQTIDEAFANAESASASQIQNLRAEVQNNYATNQRINLVESTLTESFAQSFQQLESNFENNYATNVQLQETFANAEEAFSTALTELAANVENNYATNTSVETVFANAEQAIAETENRLRTEVENSYATIDNLNSVQSNLNESIAISAQNLATEFEGNYATNESLSFAISNEQEARAQEISQLSATVDDRINSEIENIQEVISNNDEARATQIQNLTASFEATSDYVLQETEANIQRTDQAIANTQQAIAQTKTDLTATFTNSLGEVNTGLTQRLDEVDANAEGVRSTLKDTAVAIRVGKNESNSSAYELLKQAKTQFDLANQVTGMDLQFATATRELTAGINDQFEAFAQEILKLDSTTLNEFSNIIASLEEVSRVLTGDEGASVEEFAEILARVLNERVELEARITDNATAIATETEVRTQQFQEVSSKIATEEEDREAAIQQVSNTIANESETRANQFNALNAKIETETSNRESSINELSDVVSDEVETRASQFSELSSRIDNEESERKSEITNLTQTVTDANSTTAEQINTLSSQIETEQERIDANIEQINQTTANENETRARLGDSVAATKRLRDLGENSKYGALQSAYEHFLNQNDIGDTLSISAKANRSLEAYVNEENQAIAEQLLNLEASVSNNQQASLNRIERVQAGVDGSLKAISEIEGIITDSEKGLEASFALAQKAEQDADGLAKSVTNIENEIETINENAKAFVDLEVFEEKTGELAGRAALGLNLNGEVTGLEAEAGADLSKLRLRGDVLEMLPTTGNNPLLALNTETGILDVRARLILGDGHVVSDLADIKAQDGKDGVDGKDGEQGSKGDQGPPGSPGSDGQPGAGWFSNTLTSNSPSQSHIESRFQNVANRPSIQGDVLFATLPNGSSRGYSKTSSSWVDAALTVNGSIIASGTIAGPQLTGDAIDGRVITGSTLRTAASGARVEVQGEGNKNQVAVYNSSNHIEALLKAGEIRLGTASGQRLEWDSNGLGIRNGSTTLMSIDPQNNVMDIRARLTLGDGHQVNSLDDIRAEDGEQGPPGPQGQQGPKGDTGSRGPKGEDGDVGAGFYGTTYSSINWSTSTANSRFNSLVGRQPVKGDIFTQTRSDGTDSQSREYTGSSWTSVALQVNGSIVANGTIAGNKLMAASVNTRELAAKSVRIGNIAGKPDFNNLIPNGNFESGDFDGWTSLNSGLSVTARGSRGDSASQNQPFNFAMIAPSDGQQYQQWGAENVSISAGEELACEFYMAAAGSSPRSTTWQIRVRFDDSDGNQIAVIVREASTSSVSWSKAELEPIVAPSGAVNIRQINIRRTGGGSGSSYISGISVRRRNAAALIVNGGIQADQLSADAIDGKTITGAVLRGGSLTLAQNNNSGFFSHSNSNPFGSTNDLVEWYGPKISGITWNTSSRLPIENGMSKANAKSYKTVNGDEYFGGSFTAGTFSNQKTSSIITNTPVVELEFGSNGNNIEIAASISYSTVEQLTSSNCPTSLPSSPTVTLIIEEYVGSKWNTRSQTTQQGSVSCIPGGDANAAITYNANASTTHTDSSGSSSNRRYRARATFSNYRSMLNTRVDLSLITNEA